MISIAMTTYNGSKYLRKQLDSILSQTISDFELIICDDNSSDNTFLILEEYRYKDNRISVHKNATNLGFRKNFEKAISFCKGEYIALCDQDDIWRENHLRLLIDNLKDATASVGNAQIMDEYDNLSSDLLSERDCYLVDGDDEWKLSRVLLYGNPFQGTSSLYKKELFNVALPIPDDVEYHDSWFSACACCMNGLNYSFEPITNYRIHSFNASGDHKITLMRQAKNTFNRGKFRTDRLCFITEIQKRMSNLSDSIQKILIEAEQFHLNRINNKRLKVISYLIRNYKCIYSVKNYNRIFLRCIAILFWG